MNYHDAFDQPLQAKAVEGEVYVRSPGCNFVQVAMTPEAILSSLNGMRTAAYEAIAQSAARRARGRD